MHHANENIKNHNSSVVYGCRFGKHGKIDNLNIKYYGNQLEEIEEDAAELLYSGSFDYKGSRGSHYAYNANGSLICDRSRNIAYISYDFNNNPQAIYFTDGSVTKYIYSATGEKLRTVHLTAVPNITRAMAEHTELTEAQILSADSTDYLFGGRLILRNDAQAIHSKESTGGSSCMVGS